MLRLDANNSHSTLVNCYRILGDNIASQDLSSVGSSGGGGRTRKQADLALAAKVVRVIDTKMQPLPRAFYEFVYSSSSDLNQCYGVLVRRLHVILSDDLDHEKDSDYFMKVVSLSMIAPWEAKHRMFNCHGKVNTNRGVLHSSERLAELLGIDRSKFRRRYADHWKRMLEEILHLDFDNSYIIGERVDELSRYADDLKNFDKTG